MESTASTTPFPAPTDDELRLRTYPDPYPDTWYPVSRSDELRGGAVQPMRLGDHRLVVFRGRDGAVGALDAYCPHLGADLSGGSVCGNHVRCPFHHWEFDAGGRVARVPYASGPLPATLRTRTWPVEERFGFVWVWYSRSAARRGATPAWPLPDFPEIGYGRLVERGHWDGGTIPMHLMEITENGADLRHFDVVHHAMLVPFTSLRVPFASVVYPRTHWEVDAELPHVSHLTTSGTVVLFGRTLEGSRGDARVSFYGPGTLIALRIGIPGLGEVLLLQAHTPLGPLEQRVNFRWYASPQMPRLAVAWIAGAWIAQVREDFAIWGAKIHVRKPMIVEGDGPILAFRTWYRQFMSEDRPRARP